MGGAVGRICVGRLRSNHLYNVLYYASSAAVSTDPTNTVRPTANSAKSDPITLNLKYTIMDVC